MIAAMLTSSLEWCSAAPKDQKCQPVPEGGPYDLAAIEAKTWYEFWTDSIRSRHNCVVRKFDHDKKVMVWTEQESLHGERIKEKVYPYDKENDLNLQDAEGTFFQRVMGTDNSSWLVLHTCFEKQGEGRLIILLSNPAIYENNIKHLMELYGFVNTLGLRRGPFHETKCMENPFETSTLGEDLTTIAASPTPLVSDAPGAPPRQKRQVYGHDFLTRNILQDRFSLSRYTESDWDQESADFPASTEPSETTA